MRSGPTRYDSGADDKQIVFGSISGLTGVIDAMRPEAARAYFKFINDQGGVNGRKLVLKIYDDQWDVTRNAALHRQAFEQDKVFAFVSSLAPLTTHGGVPFVEANKIPVIGGDEVDLRAWPVSPYYYATGSLEALHGGAIVGRLAVHEGCKRMGSVTWNIDESRKVADSFLRGVKAAGGGDFVYRAESGLAETDFTAYAVQIKQANVDCMTVPMFDTYAVRLKQALRQVGHSNVRFYQVSNFYTPLTRQSGLFEGDYGLIPTDVVENAPNNPAMAEFLRVVAKYEPGLKDKINGWAMKAYAGAQLAVEALKRAGNDLTRANLLNVLNSITNLDLGTVPPLTFRPGNHEGGKCGALVQVKNSQFVVVKRWLCA